MKCSRMIIKIAYENSTLNQIEATERVNRAGHRGAAGGALLGGAGGGLLSAMMFKRNPLAAMAAISPMMATGALVGGVTGRNMSRKGEIKNIRRKERGDLKKEAIIGPSIDLGMFGIPSMIGYSMGKRHAAEDVEIDESQLKPNEKLLRHLLMPGSLGYWGGYSTGTRDRKQKEAKKDLKEKENPEKTASGYIQRNTYDENTAPIKAIGNFIGRTVRDRNMYKMKKDIRGLKGLPPKKKMPLGGFQNILS